MGSNGPRKKLERALMASSALVAFGRRSWYHGVRTAEANSAVVVARDEMAAARRYGPAKFTASNIT